MGERWVFGWEHIRDERLRQINEEFWTPEHGAIFVKGELTLAALSYAITAVPGEDIGKPQWWPWDESWWKPSEDPIRNLEKAGALIAAEIDRLIRKKTEERTDNNGVVVKVEDDWSGSGHVTRVIVNGVLVWSWAHHIDGPLPIEARGLLDSLKPLQFKNVSEESNAR